MALSKWGMILNENGQGDQAKSTVWPLVNFDLDWVVENWNSEGKELEHTTDDHNIIDRPKYIQGGTPNFAGQVFL